jgi:hypothetical protein
MDRRTFLAMTTLGSAVGTAGCVAGGRVVQEQQQSILVEPGRGWTYEITEVDGDGELSYTVRAEQRFDIYYFTSTGTYDHYRTFLGGDEPPEMPAGHSKFSRAGVHNEDRDLYEARVPEDGGRASISVADTHYFVVDYSNYGMGVPVEEHADPLDAFVDLVVFDTSLPI